MKNQSVIVGLSGGLGNQLFQYAAGRALSLKLSCGLKLDISWFYGQENRAYALKPFAICADLKVEKGILPAWIKSVKSRFERRWSSKRFGIPIFREHHFHFDKKYSSINQPVFIEGFWQSEKYFFEYKNIIFKEFTLQDGLQGEFLSMAEKIKSTDAICIHIRRGDYVTNSVALQTHGVCTLDYYYKGVEQISLGLLNPHCFIFSDDQDWARENIKLMYPTTFVNLANSDEAHLDLSLMSQCKHFVIANSSLSWWGATLATNSKKRVIAPKKWFSSDKNLTNDLIPNSWHRL